MAKKLYKRQSNKTVDIKKSAATAIYISTVKEDNEELGFDVQHDRLKAYCMAQGWSIDSRHVYIDKSFIDRFEFQRMMKASELGLIERIVSIQLDRIAHGVLDFLGIVDELDKANVDLVLVKESIDSGSPQGRFILTAFAAIAELESKLSRNYLYAKTLC